MSKRLWWSVVFPMTALCLLAAVASAAELTTIGPDGVSKLQRHGSGGVVTRPGLINPLCGLMTGPSLEKADCDSQNGREWEGIASTDYYSFVQEGVPGSTTPVPNPDIAAGPDDLVATAGKKIVRYPNPNAARFDNNNGTASVAYNPANSFIFPPTSQQFIDTWIGEAAINELCPTFPRNSSSCVFDNLSVRYDQMQGRFVVLFTVVDTGLLNCSGCAGTPTPISGALRRKASWVLIASRWATGCQGTGGGFLTACVPDPEFGIITPGAPPLTGNTEFFTTPQPPGTSQSNPNSGGVNSNWLIYYGAATASTSQGGDGICPTGGCPFGNINDISDLRNGVAAPTGAVTIDCNNTATLGTTTTVCYFPSSARLGLDNDNIIISSSVYNDNIPLGGRVLPGAEDPTNTNFPGGLQPAWEGTRVRVYKKSMVYTGDVDAGVHRTVSWGGAGGDAGPGRLV